ncbi:MAG TPA: phospho-N-acetylmuramoyl-pentapeptide-transferase [Clostridiales bacterium]|nr:phospho-N-acetylmuramoyl-pentapeptide-transferase [Clostridiales bacterium]
MRYYATVVILAFLSTLLMGILLIPWLRRLKLGQTVRDDGPKTHLSKSGTPQMGGIIFLIPLILISLLLPKGNREYVMVAAITTAAFGIIGFIDDYIKVVKKRSLGLRGYQKIISQLVVAVGLAFYAYNNEYIGSSMIIPFLGTEWDLGIFYIPVAVFIIIGTVNSVNLTDGLDGLCSGVTLIVSATLSIIITSAWQMADEQGLSWLADNYQDLIVFSAALTGVCLGFLRYNAYPAQVFMGDTGAFGLGGAVSALSILLRIPLWLPIIGGVYMAESISDIIQVASFKLRGKRVFKMAPLHHHFELLGMPETKVVSMFMIATAVLCLFALLSI